MRAGPVATVDDPMDEPRRALREIVEEWAGAECGAPVYAQEAYAIALARRMYRLAADALTPGAGVPARNDDDH